MIDLAIDIPEPKLLVERITEGIRNAITSGRLKPGQQLKEIEIADSLGVSRSPVREAFRILQLENLVDVLPRKGAHVHTITIDEVVDIYQTREMIECFAYTLLVDTISTEDIQYLEKLLATMDNLAKKEELELFLEASTAFHNKFISLTQNKKIEDIYSGLSNWIKFLRSMIHGTHKKMDRTKSSLIEHHTIIDAIRNRDGELVEALSREHVRKGRDHLLSIIKQTIL